MTKEEELLRNIQVLEARNQELQSRLSEAEETMRAISAGEVDALVVYSDGEEHIYTLKGADYTYRVMVESIHEGAANITDSGTILYSNKRLAEMLKKPLEGVLGSSFFDYLKPDEKDNFLALSRKGLENFGRAEFSLACAQGPAIPVLITASAVKVDHRDSICLVVTDLTEQKNAMARERELQIRLMDQREEERMRIARNLHDGPLQDLLGLSYTLEAMTSAPEKQVEISNILTIRENILKLAGDLRTVCNELRPPNIIRFGLAKAIRYHMQEVQSKKPELELNLKLADDGQLIPKEISTALFRIFQECINNIIRHSQATMVEVSLILDNSSVIMEVKDNGQGFSFPGDWVDLARQGHLGLVGMRERAEAVGGKLHISSESCKGTTIKVDVPCEACRSINE